MNNDDVACQLLWAAVIRSAFLDAGGRAFLTAQEQRVARDWLLNDSKDFGEVCSLAGYEPEYIRQQARRLAEAGWPVKENLRKRNEPEEIYE